MNEKHTEYFKAVQRLKSTIRPSAAKNYMSGSTTDDIDHKKQRFYLERTHYLLQALGHPEKAGFKVVHVAGTSGKGSTSTMIYESLVAANQNVGIFTSPYVTTPLENIQLNGELADPQVFAEAVHQVVEIAKQIEKKKPEMIPSYSEIFYAVALKVFEASGVEWIVLETGCGGRFDYTRTMPDSAVVATVLTPIAIDHVVVLGDTIEQIAWHKAGIIRPNTPVITAAQPNDAMRVINLEAEQNDSVVVTVAAEDGYVTTMPGKHQQQNATVADITGHFLGIPQEAVTAGIKKAKLPARVEVVQEPTTDSPLIVIDGAHSPAKVGALVESLAELRSKYNTKKTHLIFSAKETKDISPIVDLLAPYTDSVVAAGWQLEGFKSVDPEKVVAEFSKRNVEATSAENIQAAVDQIIAKASPEDMIIVTGSLYGAGFARERWISEEQILEERSVFG